MTRGTIKSDRWSNGWISCKLNPAFTRDITPFELRKNCGEKLQFFAIHWETDHSADGNIISDGFRAPGWIGKIAAWHMTAAWGSRSKSGSRPALAFRTNRGFSR